MVFFTCFYCGESVKKAAVTKHYSGKCRNELPRLTCVDCLSDFLGNEHLSHTKCVTEDEKYSARTNAPKEPTKGEKKQQSWTEWVKNFSSIVELPADEQEFMRIISTYDNIPRTKNKFMNFLNSITNKHFIRIRTAEKAFNKMQDYYQKHLENQAKERAGNAEEEVKEQAGNVEEEVKEEAGNAEEAVEEEAGNAEEEAKEQSTNEPENGENLKGRKRENEEKVSERKKTAKRRKKDKKKNEEEELSKGTPRNLENGELQEESTEEKKTGEDAQRVSEEEQRNEEEEKLETKTDHDDRIKRKIDRRTTGFEWRHNIISVIMKKGLDNVISLNALQKRVLNKYCRVFECTVNDKLNKKFIKKLKNISQVSIHMDYVILHTK